MIKLKNIKRDNNIITCVAYPEDCEVGLKMTINIEDETEEYEPLPKGYEYCKGNMAMGKWHLLRLLEKGEDLPENATVMWY